MRSCRVHLGGFWKSTFRGGSSHVPTPRGEIATDPLEMKPKAGTALCLRGCLSRHAFHLGVLCDLRARFCKASRGSRRVGRFPSLPECRAEMASAHFDPVHLVPISCPWCITDSWPPGETIDADAIFMGVALPGRVRTALRAYDMHLFKGATLQDMPDTPRFVIQCHQRAVRAPFGRFIEAPTCGEYRVGEVKTRDPDGKPSPRPRFPPVLCPFRNAARRQRITPDSGYDLQPQALHHRVSSRTGRLAI